MCGFKFMRHPPSRPRAFTSAVLVVLAVAVLATPVNAQTLYTHGNPTAEEQYVLELTNRARANPGAEGDRLAQATTADPEAARFYRFFPGNLGQMQSDFRSYPARPPLGFNAALMASSHAHNQDMTATGNFSFTGSDGSTFNDRTAAAGYPSTLVSGNIGRGLRAVYGVHYNLMTDFSRADLGHRHNLMNDNAWYVFREVGIAIGDYARGTGAYVTEDFGNAGTALAVGVAFRDGNSDGFYSVGEGVAGMVVSSPASRSYTITSASGGYSLPLDLLPDYTAGTRGVDLVFGDLNGNVIGRQTVALSASTQGGGLGRAYDNVKADLIYAADGRLLSPAANAVDRVSIVLKNNPAGVGAKGKFKVSRTGGNIDQPLTVDYAVGGDAEAGVNYQALSGQITIPAGAASAKIAVLLLQVPAKPKTVSVALLPPPDISTDGYTVGEGANGTATMTLPVGPSN